MKLLPEHKSNTASMLGEMLSERASRLDRRSALAAEMQRIDADLEAIQKVIDGLRHLSGDVAPEAPPRKEADQPATARNPVVIPAKAFVGISVRWAALYVLAELNPGPHPSPAIADILMEGGYVSEGKKFHSNVSAVLSVMTHQRKETEVVDGGYQITELGRLAWAAIKNTPQWAKHVASSGSVLPFAQ